MFSPERHSILSLDEERARKNRESELGAGALLIDHAELLSEMDIPVDDDARLDLKRFLNVSNRWNIDAYAKALGMKNVSDEVLREAVKEKLARDQRKAEQLQRKFAQRDSAEIQIYNRRETAELLEVMKTTSIKEWMGDDFTTVRTSLYDDYVNGVDELILHPGTKKPLAAVDTTLNRNKFLEVSVGKGRTVADVVREGASVEHGVFLDEEGGMHLGPLENLPMFVISIDAERVAEWGRLMRGSTNRERVEYAKEVSAIVLEDLIEQSKGGEQNAVNGDLREYYKEYKDLLNSI